MLPKRTDRLHLIDMMEASEAIQRFIEPIDEAQFFQDELRQSAVLQKITVIGEAAGRLSDEFQNMHPEIEWRDIVGFRNIAVHEYFAVMWEIVWNTAVDEVPALRTAISKILLDEYNVE